MAGEDGDTGEIRQTPPPTRTDRLETWAGSANEALVDLDDRLAKSERRTLLIAGTVGLMSVIVTGQTFIVSRLIKAVTGISEVLKQMNAIPGEAVSAAMAQQRQPQNGTVTPIRRESPLGPIDETIADDIGPIAEPYDPGPRELSDSLKAQVAGDRDVVAMQLHEPDPL